MEGIEEMFASFGSADEFDGQYSLEAWVRRRRERWAYSNRPHRKQYFRNYMRTYNSKESVRARIAARFARAA